MIWTMLRALLTVTSLASFLFTGDFPPDEHPPYFPLGVFEQGKADSDFSARWYAAQLRALKEPPLYRAGNPEPVYRFTWLRTFHRPVAVRVTIHPGGGGTLFGKMGSGTGGFKPGHLNVRIRRKLDAAQVDRFLSMIQAIDFWHLPSAMPIDEGFVGVDGAQWILEASQGAEYHVIDRWSPDEDNPLRELGIYLSLTLAKLPVVVTTIY